MKIASYDVNASATNKSTYYQSTSIILETEAEAAKTAAGEGSAVVLEMSEKAQNAAEASRNAGRVYVNEAIENNKTMLARAFSPKIYSPQINFSVENIEDLKIRLLETMLSALRGGPVSIGRFSGRNNITRSYNRLGVFGMSFDERQSQRMVTSAETYTYEAESVNYQASGTVYTADGKTIDLNMTMSLSREYEQYTKSTLEVQEFNLCDPLMINFKGGAAELSGKSFSFDLNMDGVMDNIAQQAEGTGFLALDKNGDSTINDGSELFGPQSGSGFNDLRAYDKDGNNWIDENDAVFEKLSIWTKDENGNDQLYKLKDLDVGAIYLGDVETNFSMKDDANNTQGVMRSTSFFLKESGGSGLVSHVDLTL